MGNRSVLGLQGRSGACASAQPYAVILAHHIRVKAAERTALKMVLSLLTLTVVFAAVLGYQDRAFWLGIATNFLWIWE